MITLQLIALLVGLAAIHLTYLYYKRMHFTKPEVLFWVLLWVAFMGAAMFPRSLQPLVGVLSLQRSMDLFMIVGFMVLFVLSFHNYVVNNRQEKRVEKLIRRLALKDLEPEDHGQSSKKK